MVFGVVSRMSINRECVLISNCSREFLCTNVDLFTVNFSVFVGNGIGPAIIAPVFSAVSIINFVVSSITLWSNDLILMRIFCLFAMVLVGYVL